MVALEEVSEPSLVNTPEWLFAALDHMASVRFVSRTIAVTEGIRESYVMIIPAVASLIWQADCHYIHESVLEEEIVGFFAVDGCWLYRHCRRAKWICRLEVLALLL